MQRTRTWSRHVRVSKEVVRRGPTSEKRTTNRSRYKDPFSCNIPKPMYSFIISGSAARGGRKTAEAGAGACPFVPPSSNCRSISITLLLQSTIATSSRRMQTARNNTRWGVLLPDLLPPARRLTTSLVHLAAVLVAGGRRKPDFFTSPPWSLVAPPPPPPPPSPAVLPPRKNHLCCTKLLAPAAILLPTKDQYRRASQAPHTQCCDAERLAEFVRFVARSDSIFFFFFSSPSLSSSSSSSSQCPLLRSLGASQSSSFSNLLLNVCFLLTYYPTSLQPPTKSTAPAARVLSLGQKFRQNEIKINIKWNILS